MEDLSRQSRIKYGIRLHNIATLEGANHHLIEEFIPRYNRMFSHPAKEPGIAYRALPEGTDLNNIFCIKEERTVTQDNTISYKEKTYQILPNDYRISFSRAKVMVHEHLNGSIHIFYKGRELRQRPISKERCKQKEPELLCK